MLLAITAIPSLAFYAPANADSAGAVYARTNAAAIDGGNEIVIYNRASNGLLTLAGRVATG